MAFQTDPHFLTFASVKHWSMEEFIRIRNASENNLRSVSLDIPANRFVVVTGISGSGKSSLVFDVICREAENRYLGSFSTHAKLFMGRLKRPAVERVDGLSPPVVVDQRTFSAGPRSTAGTITGIYDYLRLLFARVGVAGEPPFFPMILTGEKRESARVNRSLFSFNSPLGACPACNGLGLEDRLDPELLVADATKSIRDRALVITAPNGYIIYSQVTMDVMDQVCRSEGFSADIPWKDLTPDQKQIILYGSDKIEIPYGKHTLESRMRWSGITAKPREMGHYKGIIPVMETILKRDRNKNILRFVRSCECSVCGGKRLNPVALSILVGGLNIARMAEMQFDELPQYLDSIPFTVQERTIAGPIIHEIRRRTGLLTRLGLGYITSGRISSSLSGGEIRRMKLATQALTGLSGILYIFDEPSAGLHPFETEEVISVLKELRDQGNSVIVVEHDEDFIRQADWLVDLGPGGGSEGGEIMVSLPVNEIGSLPPDLVTKSRTLSYYLGKEKIDISPRKRNEGRKVTISGASHHNLRNIEVSFLLESLNVVTGVSGAGKSSLVTETLENFLRNNLYGSNLPAGPFVEITGWKEISRVISVDQSPIGRTPRSNPATYTGLSDHLRDLFASLPESRSLGFDKSRFSFNTEGGRCETCQGAGYLQVGMHFMGNVEVPCEKCEGRRFNDAVLEIRYNGKNISEILEMTVTEASGFLAGDSAIMRFLGMMKSLGLGYLTLGQRSSTISGGEAQRIKLAAELAKPQTRHTLYILDEPTTGLHTADIRLLLDALIRLVDQQNTVIIIEHHPAVILAADHVVDLGPGSGRNGGQLVIQGTPGEVAHCAASRTGKALRQYQVPPPLTPAIRQEPPPLTPAIRQVPPPLTPPPAGGGEHVERAITFTGVTTHNLKNINVAVPVNRTTVITGVSGSGKSSFAFDTLYAEGMNRYLESFSTYIRSQIGIRDRAGFEEVRNLTPTLAVDQHTGQANPRSTAGTMTGIHDLIRLLFSRVAISEYGKTPVLSSLFSFNHQHGACTVCDGLGHLTVCDPEKLVTDPAKPITGGAISGTKTGSFYGDPHGQYIATLLAAGSRYGIDFSKPWNTLPDKEKKIALYGTGNEMYDVTWSYKREARTGDHHFSGKWAGFAELVNEEYRRKHADHRGDAMLLLMKQEPCHACRGARLVPEALSYLLAGKNIHQVSSLQIDQLIPFFDDLPEKLTNETDRLVAARLIDEIQKKLGTLADLGLPYISPDRSVSDLSGGEIRRLKLAAQIGSGLTGITCVLDEPTSGLHPADVELLNRKIRDLRDSGNTVLIVEHDRDVIRSADHVIELGPGTGDSGGEIVAEGTPEELMQKNSLTGRYLKKKPAIQFNPGFVPQAGISVRNAFARNLRGFDLEIPCGGIVVITGVSGSGKSTLLLDVICASHEKRGASGCASITGLEQFDKVVPVHSRSSFSGNAGTPVTFTGCFDLIRDLFAKSEDARSTGLKKAHFSFNGKEGGCPACNGTGKIRTHMDFIADVETVCETCNGSRYREGVLSCRYRGVMISEVLAMDFSAAKEFFRDQPVLAGQMEIICKAGLGYIRLGQPLNTLSGGESQRLNLAAELMRPARGKTLYLFDEPSTGLHFLDIEYLMILFRELTSRGNTLIIVEHDPVIILQADHVIDLGPGGGNAGGDIVYEGSLPGICSCERSLTGKYLKKLTGL